MNVKLLLNGGIIISAVSMLVLGILTGIASYRHDGYDFKKYSDLLWGFSMMFLVFWIGLIVLLKSDNPKNNQADWKYEALVSSEIVKATDCYTKEIAEGEIIKACTVMDQGEEKELVVDSYWTVNSEEN